MSRTPPAARGCTRRRLLAGAGASLASVALGAHGNLRAQGEHYGDKAAERAAEKHAESAAEFPRRSITLLVPWAAGGSTDISLRVLAEQAEKQLGQTVIIENKGGAGGTLAMPLLTQAAPDGYTIAQLPQPVFRAPWVQKVLWDPIRDVTPIIQISGYTFGVVVPADSPLHGFEDLFTWAREHPGRLTVGTNGFGTTPHVVMQDLMQRRGLNWVHVPYKGTAEQMVAVASGQLMVGVNSTGFAPFVDSGKLRLLVTFADHRSKRWPTVPTLRELGYGIVAMSPYGLGGPRGLAPAVVDKLHNAFRIAMYSPAHIAEISKYDQELLYLGPAEYGQAMREAFAEEKRVVERLKLGSS